MTKRVGMNKSKFHVHHNELLVRASKIIGGLQKTVPASLTEQAYSSCKPLPTNCWAIREGCMYDKMQNGFFWLTMANDVYQTVSICAMCARNHKWTKRKRPLLLVPAAGSFEDIALYILGTLTRSKNGNVFIIAMTNWYWKTGKSRKSKEATRH